MSKFEGLAHDRVLVYLKEHNIAYIDNRNKNGCLWLLGGEELSKHIYHLKELGIKFKFKNEGGKATKGRAAWWGK